MPRPSAESLAVAPVIDVERVRLRPRGDLPAKVQRAFTEIVASVEASHFREADRAIVEELATAVAVQREAVVALAEAPLLVPGKDGMVPNPLMKIVATQGRLIASLATRCRVTPQSRISKDKAGRTVAESRPDPLQMIDFRRLRRD